MAAYYDLIAKAVASLDPNAPPEKRHALYERAQTALLDKLRSVDPPFSEAQITRERLALEEAVRRVEDEISQGVPDGHPPAFRDHITALSELASDADALGKTTAEPNRRRYLHQANTLEIGRMANPSSLDVQPPPIISGKATGILDRIWRWRSS